MKTYLIQFLHVLNQRLNKAIVLIGDLWPLLICTLEKMLNPRI